MRLNVKIPYFITTIINSFYFCQKLFAIFLPRGWCHCCQEVVAGTVIAMAITGYNWRWQQLANPVFCRFKLIGLVQNPAETNFRIKIRPNPSTQVILYQMFSTCGWYIESFGPCNLLMGLSFVFVSAPTTGLS